MRNLAASNTGTQQPVSWQRISKGERTIVTILLFCFKYLLRSLSVFIQNQCVLFLLRHTNTVIRTFYRSEIAYYQKVISFCRGFPYEAVNTSVPVICIDPLKARRIRIRSDRVQDICDTSSAMSAQNPSDSDASLPQEGTSQVLSPRSTLEVDRIPAP